MARVRQHLCVNFFQHFYFCNAIRVIILLWKYRHHHKVHTHIIISHYLRPTKFTVVVLVVDTELKNIIDKLAQFVARNGPEFEQMTKNKQKGNPKFHFLYGGEFYNYYEYKVTSEQSSECFKMSLL